MGIMFVVSKIKLKTTHAVGLVISYLVITKLKSESSTQVSTFIDEMELKLSAIGSPSHFFMDTNMIVLFYDILSWRKRNANSFDVAIDAVNNVLKLEEQSMMLSEFCVEHYEIAREQRTVALNSIYALTYELEHYTLVRNKLRAVLRRLMELLERHLDSIRMNCANAESKKDKPDVLTRYIEDAKGVKAFDPTINPMEPF